MRFSPRLAAVLASITVVLAPTASASTSQGHTSTPAASQFLGKSVPAVTTPSTVAGPSTPTTNEPGDNYPALVIGGSLVTLALIAGGWSLARTRVKDDE